MQQDPIGDFLARYSREYDFYDRVAERCAHACEDALEQAGVRAIVTHRAKRPDRLRPKLEKRHAKKYYTTVEHIYEDIVDLAGTRIALYFPGDMSIVEEIIRREFESVKDKKSFPEADAPRNPEKRFPGYVAEHYRVRLREARLPPEAARFSKCQVEIQVASVLMHAWAEVEHDLAYKPHSGTLSKEELAILDEINGLVVSGEIALGRLQHAVRDRVARQSRSFANQYELALQLYNIYRAATSDLINVPGVTLPNTEPPMGRAEDLLVYLRSVELDRSDALSQSLALWTPTPWDGRTLVEEVLAYLRNDPKLPHPEEI